jgi:GT2 family glycosyltransferase
MKPCPPVSWVIVAFHRPEPVGALVAAAADDPRIEVIVVNVEADSHVRSAVGERALVIDTADNVGYAAAVNIGARFARAEVVVFSNDDLVVDASSVIALSTAVADGDGDVALPAIETADGERELTISALPTPRTLLWEWGLLPDRPVSWLSKWFDVQKWRVPTRVEQIEAGTAAVVAVRAKLLLDEPLPEHYFLYWEEIDWFWRLRSHGTVVRFHPEIRVRHNGGRLDVRADKARLLARNAVRFTRSTQGRSAAIRALVAVILWQVRLSAVDAVRTSFRRAHHTRLTARAAGLSAALMAWREVA